MPTTKAQKSASIDTERLDAAVAALADGAASWASLRVAERAALIGRTHESIARVAERWTRTATDIKGLDPNSPLVGEEWLSGPYATLAGFGTVAHSLQALAEGKSPLDGVKARPVPGGRLAWRVLPHDLREGLLFHGFSAEVWTLPGEKEADVRAGAGAAARDTGASGGVSLVLGAGNITSIGPLDVLSELVAHNRTSILKINPTFANLLTVYRAALAPLVEADLVRVVQGGAAEGEYLCQHDGISHVHITGSINTHDAIVWGRGADADERRRDNRPLLDKPITSELGGVSPIIVVPGKWSRADLRFQAENVATMRLHNAGHNCIAGQVVVLDRSWDQREAFLKELRDALERIAPRTPWYPGSQSRLSAAADSHESAEAFSGGQRVLIRAQAGEDCPVETTEYFAPVLGVVELDADDAGAFLDRAVAYSNDDLVGTLGANILIAPAQRKQLGTAFDDAVARLRYGAIGINAWTGMAFLTPTATWGAFPGHTLDDAQSGLGIVHNGLLIPDTERTVVTGPFRPFPRSVLGGEFSLFPKPPWFVTARSAAGTGRKLNAYATAPSWLKLPGIFLSAFRA
ncbi:putative oxidoreductase [Gordonia araii NBRC 100433]|uniref:Putative oxidoreductase n=1 Tax=Gordonia araii NBRC 100433 TaxID=1073574 RepID=G7H4U2_9ACTN|nr:aldehyde dehydrogenase family protein [Gordonia araii]NNG97993.1 aldehyde dehydrogenase family protein [Gordonia araii NBRC 100433]GAB10867.1 putative oxidoreductase [Gordonia araii NBRC 100433]